MKDKIIEIVKTLSDNTEITEDSTLIDLGIDSLRTMDLLIMLEDEFDIDINEDYLAPRYFKSISTLIELVENVKK